MTDETTVAAEAARDAQNVLEKRRRGWGCFAYGVIAVLAPLLSLALGWSMMSVADEQLAAAAMQRARDAGDPLTAAEMREFYGSMPESEEATAKWIAALRATEGVIAGTGVRNVPILGSANTPETLDERGLYDAATLARAEPFLASEAAEALRRAHAARECASDVRYPITFERGYDGQVTYIQTLRTLANLLALESEVHAAKGNLNAATDSLLTLIACSETLAEAPDLVAYLVRMAIIAVASDYAMNLIDRADFPPEDLKRLQDAFARQSFHGQMLRGMQGDQYQSVHFFSARDNSVRELSDDRLSWLPLRGGDQALTLDLRRKFLEAAAEGFPEADRAAAKADARVDRIASSGIADRFRYALTQELAVAFGAYVNAALRGEAQVRIAATCCACERYRQEYGDWPPTLESLVPSYLPEVPLDPVDGQPLRYRVDGERMILHSVGHFRPENAPDMHTFGNGFMSEVLGEEYESELPAAGGSNGAQ
ncbi:MAG TPA: hypothetical protein VGN57_10530 [Pirellulaceae bacterium]|jgi:hypothetical protein|nr:hypothetical protein [Pirellulaceae bacterium]